MKNNQTQTKKSMAKKLIAVAILVAATLTSVDAQNYYTDTSVIDSLLQENARLQAENDSLRNGYVANLDEYVESIFNVLDNGCTSRNRMVQAKDENGKLEILSRYESENWHGSIGAYGGYTMFNKGTQYFCYGVKAGFGYKAGLNGMLCEIGVGREATAKGSIDGTKPFLALQMDMAYERELAMNVAKTDRFIMHVGAGCMGDILQLDGATVWALGPDAKLGFGWQHQDKESHLRYSLLAVGTFRFKWSPSQFTMIDGNTTITGTKLSTEYGGSVNLVFRMDIGGHWVKGNKNSRKEFEQRYQPSDDAF